jgi:hypothetical protein
MIARDDRINSTSSAVNDVECRSVRDTPWISFPTYSTSISLSPIHFIFSNRRTEFVTLTWHVVQAEGGTPLVIISGQDFDQRKRSYRLWLYDSETDMGDSMRHTTLSAFEVVVPEFIKIIAVSK